MANLFEVAPGPLRGAELRRFELFQELEEGELDRLARWFVELRVPAHAVILREGEPAASFYLLCSGSVAVFRDAVGQPVQLLARLHSGDFFGSLGLLGEGRSSASVRASEPTRLLEISNDDFRRFLADHPEIGDKLRQTASRRHSVYAASALELGRRREVRIRCAREVTLRLDDGTARTVTLENLSVGGVCLEGVPESWQPGRTVYFWLALREGELDLSGRVAWRRGDAAGVAFVKRSPNHDMILQMAIRLLLEMPSRPDPHDSGGS